MAGFLGAVAEGFWREQARGEAVLLNMFEQIENYDIF